VGLLSVRGRTRCPSRGWYAKEPHDKGEKAVGFMVKRPLGLWSRTQRGQGGGKEAEAQNIPGLRAFRRKGPFTCLLPVSGYGSDRVGVEQHYVSTRVTPTHPAAETTEATKRTNANRQRSKLAEASQEGEKGRGK
jgi:hypothetical protein